ncbi:sigma-54 interaction domain-containing protein [Thermodesulfobacteriota bacterium]
MSNDATSTTGKAEYDPNILLIGKAPSIFAVLEKGLQGLGFKKSRINSPDTTIDQLGDFRPDLVILGPGLNRGTCLKCVHRFKIIDLGLPILIATKAKAFEDICLDSAYDGLFHLSPGLETDIVAEELKKVLKLKEELQPNPDFPVIIGRSQAIRKIREKIRIVSDKDITVLITGESGTGKELIARSLHQYSYRKTAPLIKVNCAALPDELLESEIFGFQKGAFTGAHKNKPGRLELADKGTLFIDEIGDLSLALQVKFLQALEDKEFSRLGDTVDKVVDARIIAATNSDLWKKVSEGTFRKDLFYRLNIINVVAPPLRTRKEDLPILTDYFLNKYCYEFKKSYFHLPVRVTKHFERYHWPGNVRELENIVRRMIALSDTGFIFDELVLESKGLVRDPGGSTDDFPFVQWNNDKVKEVLEDKKFSMRDASRVYIDEAESQEILKALRITHWNRKKAAQMLQVSYKTLLNRILEYDLNP